jgi:hypothetical protein
MIRSIASVLQWVALADEMEKAAILISLGSQVTTTLEYQYWVEDMATDLDGNSWPSLR